MKIHFPHTKTSTQEFSIEATIPGDIYGHENALSTTPSTYKVRCFSPLFISTFYLLGVHKMPSETFSCINMYEVNH